jgi:hypothetical protein
MDEGGGCSSVLVFYLHMGIGEIHWREEVDPIIIIEEKIEISFYEKDIFFSG